MSSREKIQMKMHQAHLFSKLLSLVVLLILTSGCGNIAELAQGFLYPTDSANEVQVPDQPSAGYGQSVLDVPHKNGDLKIHLWYHANSTTTNVPVIVHFHGNGENLGRLAASGFLAKMETLGANFVVMDYPGYGKSTGFPEQGTLMAAAQATMAFTKKAFPNSPIIIWGWSLGSAVAFQTAATNVDSVHTLIADSAWTSIRELAKEKFGSMASQIPEELYAKNEWNSIGVVASIPAPLLMRHGSDDKLVPVNHGERVSQTANKKLVKFRVIEGKGHGDIFSDLQYWTELEKVVKSVK
jgi:pimeloyl-ACP methyl ester carboxylesterase